MDKKEKNLDKEKQAKKEQAINKSATEGKKVNPQVSQKKAGHEPRDNA